MKETANMCFMAHENEDSEVSDFNDDDYVDYTSLSHQDILEEFFSLQEAFGELFCKYKKLRKKHSKAKNQVDYLSASSTSCTCEIVSVENDELKIELSTLNIEKNNLLEKLISKEISLDVAHESCKSLLSSLNAKEVENHSLRKKVQDLEDQVESKNKLLIKFTNSTKTLSTMLGDYGLGPKRYGIGYNGPNSQAPSTSRNITFVRPNNYKPKNRYEMATCHYCLKMGHIMRHCMIKLNSTYKFKYVPYMTNENKHVPSSSIKGKETRTPQAHHYVPYKTNPQGPKMIWVPKVKNKPCPCRYKE